MTKSTSSKKVAPARRTYRRHSNCTLLTGLSIEKASTIPVRETRATAKALASPKLRSAVKARATGTTTRSNRLPRRGVAESPLMVTSSPTRVALPAVIIAGVRRSSSSRPPSGKKRFTAQEKGKGRAIILPSISEAPPTSSGTNQVPPLDESPGEENDGDWEFEDGEERGYNQEEDAYRTAAARTTARALREAKRRRPETSSAARRKARHASELPGLMEENEDEWNDEDGSVNEDGSDDDGSDSSLDKGEEKFVPRPHNTDLFL